MGTLSGVRSAQDGVNVPILNAAVSVSASGSIAAAALAATLAAKPAQLLFLKGFVVTAGGATAAALVSFVVSGLAGGSKTYYLGIPAGVTGAIVPFWVEFDVAIPASAANTAIVGTLGIAGSGQVSASVNLEGFYTDAGIFNG
jgi:hypothetical protein